ncbi:MAG: hypothetical protein ABW190_08175 [Rhizobacter sp.]
MSSETADPRPKHNVRKPAGTPSSQPAAPAATEVIRRANDDDIPPLPSMAALRYSVRDHLAWLRAQRTRWAFWKWRSGRLPRRADWPFDVVQIGRQDQRNWAEARWKLDAQQDAGPSTAHEPRAWICDFPFPNSFCIPRLVSTVVPLDRSVDEFFAAMDSELRRRIRKQLPSCRIVRAVSDADITFAEENMLRPYATARRGDGAVQLRIDEVRRIAEIGRLDVVYLNDEPVSCNLGSPIIREGKKYWSALRYGFTEAVFSDRKRWGEINALNNFVVLEWALSHGFDCYDIGYAVSEPDDGLLQWKKRQGGAIGTMHNHDYDYVSLPRSHRPRIFWESPIFAIEQGKVTLHLGLPAEEPAESVLKRYRHMGFEGLGKVYLHCDRTPEDALLAGLQKLYGHLKTPPPIETTNCRP